MTDRIADPKALGFGALGIGFWMHGMAYAGWFPLDATATGVGQSAAVFATFALLVAALASFLRDETWHAVFFMFWSAIFWGVKTETGADAASAYAGWYFLTIAVFSLLLWLGAQGDEDVGKPAVLASLGILLTFVAFALGGWGLGGVFWVVGGYVGLVVAALAFWATADALLAGRAGPAPEASAGDTAGAEGTGGF